MHVCNDTKKKTTNVNAKATNWDVALANKSFIEF
jgi:hypothetical protein